MGLSIVQLLLNFHDLLLSPRTDLVTTISREWLDQSQWNIKTIITTRTDDLTVFWRSNVLVSADHGKGIHVDAGVLKYFFLVEICLISMRDCFIISINLRNYYNGWVKGILVWLGLSWLSTRSVPARGLSICSPIRSDRSWVEQHGECSSWKCLCHYHLL